MKCEFTQPTDLNGQWLIQEFLVELLLGALTQQYCLACMHITPANNTQQHDR